MKRLLTLVVACVAMAACTAPAAASTGQVSIFQDDRILRESGPEVRAKALEELDRLGVDVVKMLVNWRHIAPPGERKPDGFDGANPASYNPDAWAPYDDFVRGAQARGMRVLFALGGLAPDWASSGTDHSPGARKPHLGEFHRFVRAVGSRYSGSYGSTGTAPPPGDPSEEPGLPPPLRVSTCSRSGTSRTGPRGSPPSAEVERRSRRTTTGACSTGPRPR
jgi:hypothetical protein